MIRNKTQQLNHETTSVIRHLFSNKEFTNGFIKYLSFIAPTIHQDTKEFLDYQIVKTKTDKYNIFIKPYKIQNFVDTILNSNILEDMQNYTEEIFNDFKIKLG